MNETASLLNPDARNAAVDDLAALDGLWRLLDALDDLAGAAVGEALTPAELWACGEAARRDDRLADALALLGMATLRRERVLLPRTPARRVDPHVEALLGEVAEVAADPDSYLVARQQFALAGQYAREWRRAPAAALAPAVLRVRLKRPLLF